MYIKALLLVLFIYYFPAITIAQKVKRKGATATREQKNEPVSKYSINQLQGKWQEVKRISVKDNNTVDFTDSLLMIFTGSKVTLKDVTSMRMTMNGEAETAAPNTLIVAGDTYSILSLGTAKLVIKDDEFTRELEIRSQLQYESYGKVKIETDTLSNPVNIDIHILKGNWFIYAKKAEPGSVSDKTALIKSLNINSINDEGIAFGEVAFYVSGITRTAACQLVTQRGVLKIISDKESWTFTIYKADGKEFIFGEKGKLVYFSKMQ